MKKVIIDKDKCIGCGACVSIAPDCFDFDDQGLSELVKEDATNEEVIDAIESCPTEAIYIEDDEEKAA